jgi:hypothetical protein
VVARHERKPTWLQPVRLAVASWATVITVGNHAGAASSRNERAVASVEARAAGAPLMAIVSLRSQRIMPHITWLLGASRATGDNQAKCDDRTTFWQREGAQVEIMRPVNSAFGPCLGKKA